TDTPLLGQCVERGGKRRPRRSKAPQPARKATPAAPRHPGADPKAIEKVLTSLRQHNCGWRGSLPKTFGTFFGHPLGIDIETRSVRGAGPPPGVSPDEAALARAVLAGLPDVLKEAE